MTAAIPLDSDTMGSICRCLNKDVGGLKNWRHFASTLKVPREIFKDFNPKDLKSPTEMLFKWLSTDRPELKVPRLCTALEAIGRRDVVLLIKEKVDIS